MALGTHRAPHTQAGASTPTRGSTHAPKTPNPAPSKPKKAALTPGRVQRLLQNAGTRAALPDQYLPAAQLAQRRLNRRLAAPVTAGSSMTERDLAQQTRTAADVRYGGAQLQGQQNVAQAQQVQRDTGDYYDAYLRELAAHQKNIAGYQQQAQTAVQGLSQAGTSLGSGAAQGLTGENAQVAQNASAVRKALTDSFGAMLASQGANANTYADTLAHVVGPGQKLQAQQVAQGGVGKARQQLEQLVRERGAFREQLAGETRQSEAKNVLATAIAGGKSVQDQAQLAETVRSHKASETNTAAATAARSSAAAGKTNSHGYTTADWNALSTERRREIIAQDKKTPSKSTTNQYGAKPATAVQRGALKDKVESAVTYAQAMKDQGIPRAKALKALKLGVPKDPKVEGSTAVPRTDWLVAIIALDKAYYGKVTQATLKQIHQRGYSVNQLGLPVAAVGWKPKPPPPTGSTIGAVVGGGLP